MELQSRFRQMLRAWFRIHRRFQSSHSGQPPRPPRLRVTHSRGRGPRRSRWRLVRHTTKVGWRPSRSSPARLRHDESKVSSISSGRRAASAAPVEQAVIPSDKSKSVHDCRQCLRGCDDVCAPPVFRRLKCPHGSPTKTCLLGRTRSSLRRASGVLSQKPTWVRRVELNLGEECWGQEC